MAEAPQLNASFDMKGGGYLLGKRMETSGRGQGGDQNTGQKNMVKIYDMLE